MSARIFMLTAMLMALPCACTTRDDAGRHDAAPRAEPVTPPSTQMTTQTGTLRGGMMAIGGETSGWTLVGDGAVGGVELDVSNVEQDAKRLEGTRVTVSGRMVDKQYVERGRVRLMMVERIEEASPR